MAFIQRAAVATALGFGLGLGAAHATGTPITLKTDGYTSTSTHAATSVKYGWDTVSVDAGSFQVTTSAGKSFLAFCAEISQFTSSNWQTYYVGTFGSTDQALLQGLFSSVATFSGTAKVDSGLEYAALQLAVWEIMHETASTASLTKGSGTLYVNDTSASGLSLASLANTYLSAAYNWEGPSLVKVEKLSNGSYQDLVRVTPVPEAGTFGLMALGLAGLALVRRRAA